jgi:hypothetical protein
MIRNWENLPEREYAECESVHLTDVCSAIYKMPIVAALRPWAEVIA